MQTQERTSSISVPDERAQRGDFGAHLKEMARAWPIILAMAVLAALAVGGYGLTRPSEFEATATLRAILDEAQDDDGSATDFRTRTFAELVSTPGVAASAVEMSGVALSLDEAEDHFEVRLRDTPGYFEIVATAATRAEAVALADAMAAALIETSGDGSTVEGASLSVVADAEESTPGRSSRVIANALAAALAAAIVTGEAVLVIRRLRGRLSPVAAADEVASILGVPTVSLSSDNVGQRSLPFVQAQLGERRRIVVIEQHRHVPASVAASLAWASSESDRSVVVVDTASAAGGLADVTGSAPSPGLGEVAEGRVALMSALRAIGLGGRMWALTSGESSVGGPVGPGRVERVMPLFDQLQVDQLFFVVRDDAVSSLHALLGTTGVDAVVVAVDGSATRRELAALAESVALAGTSIAAAVVVEGAEPVVPAGSLAHQPAPTAQ